MEQATSRAMAGPVAPEGLDDGKQGQDGEGKGRPVDKAGGLLLGVNSKERPRNSDGTSNVTLRGRVGVCGRCGLEEEEAEEDENFSENARLVMRGINSEGFKSGE